MFDINTLRFKNFKSYRDEHILEFPTEPGLYYLTGINTFNPRLDKNGTGKTTILDAINWVLFNRTTRRLRAGDVISWDRKNCEVQLNMNLRNEDITLTRTQNPNSLILTQNNKDTTIDQDSLEHDLLGLNQDAFYYSILLPQFGNSFFDLAPRQKLDLFSLIMDLDFWLEKSDQAMELTQNISSRLDKIDVNINNCRRSITSLSEDINMIKERIKTFNRDKQLKIEALEESKYGQYKEVKRLLSAIKTMKEKSTRFNKEKNELQKEYDLLRNKNDMVISKITELSTKINITETLMSRTKDDIEKAKNLQGKECPLCYQKVSEDHIQTHIEPLRKELKKHRLLKQKLTRTYDTIAEDGEQNNCEISELQEQLRVVNEDITAYRIKISTALARKETLQRYFDSLENDIEKEKESKNPFQDILDDKTKELSKARSRLKDLKGRREELNIEYESYNFWINGFKRVRLFIIEQALKGLEIEVNNNFLNLGLIDWQCNFDVERETKSGTISHGFSVFIKTPVHSKPVRWESWSGGETQRLRFAGDLGLSNLILDYSGLQSQIEFHDEPSEHLTDVGVDDVIETLYERAHSLEKKIWLVDHQNTNFGDFSGKLLTTFDGNTSSFEWVEN